MVRLPINDPKSVVNRIMVDYINNQFAAGYCNSTVTAIANTLVGERVQERYRFDITDPQRISIAKQYLRGLIADYGI